MGKTLGKILSVATAPISLIDKRAGEIISGITLTAIGVASGNPALIAAGLSEFSQGLQSKPPGPHGQDTSQKTGIPDRVGAYGRSGLVGKYAFYQTDPNSGVAADQYAVHDNWWAPIDAVEGLYLGDDRVANHAGVIAGLPDGTYTDGKVEIDVRLGARVNTAFSQIVALFPSVTAASRGDGVTTAMVTWQPVKSKHYTKYYSKGQPALRMVARWSKVYDWRDSSQSLTDPLTWKWSENPVLHYVHYELIRDGAQPTERMVIAGVENPAFAPQLAAILQAKWNKLFAPTVAMWSAAANDCDSGTAVPIVRVVSSSDQSSGDHTISVPNTNGLWNGATITYSALDNINHTETLTVASFTAGSITFTGALAYKHPQGSAVIWTADADHPLSEQRYRSCVSHSLTDAHKDTKAAIISTFDGWVAPREDGALVVYSGRYVAPTVTIGPDQIVTASRDDGIEDENAVNELTLTYTEAALDYKVVDCSSWRDDDDIAKRGRIATQPLQNQVPSYTQARRLAKRQLARAMAPYRGTVTTNADGRGVIGQRYINLRIIEGGATFYDGPAEITSLTNNLETGGVTFDWVAADPNIDSWNPATEAGDPAPVGNVVSAAALIAPTITTATVEYGAQAADGTTGTYAQLTVTNPMGTREDITWEVRSRTAGFVTWGTRDYPDITPGATVTINTEFLAANASIEIEAAYTTGDGRQSDWSNLITVDTSTDLTPPDAASVPVLQSWTNALVLETTAIPRARIYRWRLYDTAPTPNLITSIDTTTNSLSYTAAQAAIDGIQRAYVVKVSGVNSAGEGTAALTGTLSKVAPVAVTGVTATGGATGGEVDFTPLTSGDIAGYLVAAATVSGFDPMTQGFSITAGGSPAYLQNIAAGTYYTKVAAYDSWTSRPDQLNFSSEASFVVTTGGGGTGSGGGGGGGGYHGGGGHVNSV